MGMNVSDSVAFILGGRFALGTSQIDCGAGNAIALSEPTASPLPIGESIGFAGTVTGSLVSASARGYFVEREAVRVPCGERER